MVNQDMRATAALALTAALLLPLAALAAPGAAQDPSDERRKVIVDYTPAEAKIRLERQDVADSDLVAIRFSTAEGLFELRYENVVKATDTTHEKMMTTVMHQIVEYRDTDRDDAYDPGEPIVSSYLLSSDAEVQTGTPANGTVAWQPITVMDVERDGKSGKRITAHAALPAGAATLIPGLPLVPPASPSTFDIDVWVFGDFLTFEDVNLRPTEVKIDIGGQNYPFREEGTRLAVVYETLAEDQLQTKDVSAGSPHEGLVSQKTLGDRDVSLEFAWKKTVRADGIDRPVHRSDVRTEDRTERDRNGTFREVRTVYALDYDRAKNITHDPVLGVHYEVLKGGGGLLGGGGDLPAPGVAVLAVAALGLVLVLRRRRA